MRATHSKQSGELQCIDWSGKVTRGATVQCCHCQHTWEWAPGSGTMRGYCQNCMGFVCGPLCADCIPLEVRLENMEAGRPELTPAPVKIFVPPGIDDVIGG